MDADTRASDQRVVFSLVLLSCLPYLVNLGLYHDDWAYIASYSTAANQDLWSLIRLRWTPIDAMRPATIVYHSLLYWAFGNWLLGYHIVNSLVLALSAAMAHRVLTRLDIGPARAFAVALVIALLPHAATTRFWYTAFTVNPSIALLWMAALCELRALDGAPRWRFGAVACLCVSAAFYEIAIPMFAALPLVSLLYVTRARAAESASSAMRPPLLLYPGVCVSALLLKAATTTRLEETPTGGVWGALLSHVQTAFAAPGEPLMWGFNLWTALRIAFVDLGLSLPARALESVQAIDNRTALGVTAVVFIVVLAWMSGRSMRSRHEFTRAGGTTCVAIGMGLFLLGWVVFLGSSRLQLTATGLGNRTAGAAALGVGVLFSGVFEYVTTFAPRRRQQTLFALLTAVTAACCLLIVYRVAEDWGRAWTRSREIVGQIHARFPGGFSGKTLLLDGVCQYVGPAPVFEASWDLEWSLQAEYGDTTIRAEVVTPNLELRDQHMRTTAYGDEKLYPYPSTILYRPSDDVVRTIDSRDAAEAFFEEYDFDRSGGCPQGRIGHGVDIFTPTGELRYVAGFYPPEQTIDQPAWRWMSGLGIVSLPNTHQDMVLTIRAGVPDQVTPPPRIRITFNGHLIDQIDGVRDINKSYTLNAAAQGKGRSSELRIATAKAFIPAELDAQSPDRRRLALVVYDIDWK